MNAAEGTDQPGSLARCGLTASENRGWRICSMQQIFSLHITTKGPSKSRAAGA